MLKTLKIFSYFIFSLVVILILGVVVLTTLVNPNDLKGPIIEQVKQFTGREFAINGDLHWSFFPWVGLHIYDASLGNKQGFTEKTFAALDEADVSVKVLPLFDGRLEISNVALKGLHISLIKNKDGVTNWQDLLASKQQKKEEQKAGKFKLEPMNMSIAKVIIENAKLNYADKQSNHHYSLSNFNFKSNDISLKQTFPITTSFAFASNDPKIQFNINIKTDFQYDQNSQDLLLSKLQLDGKLIEAPAVQKPFDFSFSGDTKFNLNQKSISIEDLALNLANLKLSGELSGTDFSNNPTFKGLIKVAKFNPKLLMANLGMKPLNTADTNAFKQISGETNFQLKQKIIYLDKLHVNFDDSSVNGNVKYAQDSKQPIIFNLSTDTININRYLAATENSKTTSQQESKKVDTADSNASFASLRKLNLKGNLKIGNVLFQKLAASKFSLEINANNGIIKVLPIKANMYQGTYQGQLVLNVQGRAPQYLMKENFANIQIESFLAAISEPKRFKLSGLANMNADLKTSGMQNKDLIRNLQGNIAFNIKNGVVKGFDIRHQLSVASALFSKQTSTEGDTGQTSFGNLTGTLHILNGVVTNQDLLLQSPMLHASGQGIVNLPNTTIDYRLQIKSLGTQTIVDQKVVQLQDILGGTIPVRISGTFDNCKIYPDAQTILAARAKAFVKQQTGVITEKVKSQLGSFGEVLQQNLENVLK